MNNPRKVILYIAMSLDGFIADKDGNIDWLLKFQLPDEDYGYNEFVKRVDTVIMGRKTYDKVVSMGFEYPHGNMPCYIITRTAKPPKKSIVYYTKGLKELIEELREKEGKNIYVDGGAEVVNELMKHNLIDEYIISVVPILLGDGIRLFNGGRPEERLMLKSCKSFETGMAQFHYTKN